MRIKRYHQARHPLHAPRYRSLRRSPWRLRRRLPPRPWRPRRHRASQPQLSLGLVCKTEMWEFFERLVLEFYQDYWLQASELLKASFPYLARCLLIFRVPFGPPCSLGMPAWIVGVSTSRDLPEIFHSQNTLRKHYGEYDPRQHHVGSYTCLHFQRPTPRYSGFGSRDAATTACCCSGTCRP